MWCEVEIEVLQSLGFGPESKSPFWERLRLGTPTPGIVLFLNCTLNPVLCSQCTVLAGCAASSMCCRHATLLLHISLEHTLSPRVGVWLWARSVETKSGVLNFLTPESESESHRKYGLRTPGWWLHNNYYFFTVTVVLNRPSRCGRPTCLLQIRRTDTTRYCERDLYDRSGYEQLITKHT